LFSELFLWISIGSVAAIFGWALYHYSSRSVARRDTQRMSNALMATHNTFAALDHVPSGMVTRDLRKGLVMMLAQHLNTLREVQPRHPHLYELDLRVQRLNKIPSGMLHQPIRSKKQRREAVLALEELAQFIKQAGHTKLLPTRVSALAHAAATFAAQQVAVESARHAAKDAENLHAYRHALNFYYQAHALCRKLPPLAGKALSEAVTLDIERLESLSART